jgi:hypothetical protein
VAATAMSAPYASAQQFQAKFSGFNELGALNSETGAILSAGQATLILHLNQQAQSLTYTLTYSNPSTPTWTVQQAHIHFGKIHVPGGVMVFLCTNLGNGPAGTPTCPNPSATGANAVTGMLTPASVQAIPGQNVTAGDFAALTAALLSNTAYGNIHTANFPKGEIRGEIRRPEDDEDR